MKNCYLLGILTTVLLVTRAHDTHLFIDWTKINISHSENQVSFYGPYIDYDQCKFYMNGLFYDLSAADKKDTVYSMNKMIQFTAEHFNDLKNERRKHSPSDVEIPGALLQEWVNKQWQNETWFEQLEILSHTERQNPEILDKEDCEEAGLTGCTKQYTLYLNLCTPPAKTLPSQSKDCALGTDTTTQGAMAECQRQIAAKQSCG